MRVLVDRWVFRALPPSVDPAGSVARIDVFPEYPTPSELLSAVVRSQPDIVVVRPAWIVIADLIRRILDLGGCDRSVCVVGSVASHDVLKIRAVRSGFFDIVDLGRPGGEVIEHFREIHAGESRLFADRIWTRIERTTGSIRVAGAANDQTDEEILELLSLGLSDRDISSAVHLSLQAVRNRVSSLLERSGCTNRTQLGWTHTSHKLIEVLCGQIAGPSDR